MSIVIYLSPPKGPCCCRLIKIKKAKAVELTFNPLKNLYNARGLSVLENLTFVEVLIKLVTLMINVTHYRTKYYTDREAPFSYLRTMELPEQG